MCIKKANALQTMECIYTPKIVTMIDQNGDETQITQNGYCMFYYKLQLNVM
jgi:hypothetical protein